MGGVKFKKKKSIQKWSNISKTKLNKNENQNLKKESWINIGYIHLAIYRRIGIGLTLKA